MSNFRGSSIIRKTKCSQILKRNVLFTKTKCISDTTPYLYYIIAFQYNLYVISQKNRPPSAVFKRSTGYSHAPFFIFRFVASLPLYALRLRDFGQRFERADALRFDDFSAEGQARADIRARVRGIVIRNRARHTAIRARVVVPTINHTAF